MNRPAFLFLFLLIPATAGAVDRTWTNGGGDHLWNNANNWDPVGVPAAGDNVIFTDVSPGVDTYCGVNIAAVCNQVTLAAGYTQNVSGSGSLTVGAGGVSQSGGYIGNNLTVNGPYLLAGGTLSGAPVLNGTVTQTGGELSVSGADVNADYTATGGTFDILVQANFSGNLTLAPAATVAAIFGDLVFDGTSPAIQEFDTGGNSLALTYVDVAGTSTVRIVNNDLHMFRLQVLDGTFDANGRNIICDGIVEVAVGATYIVGSGTSTFADSCTVYGFNGTQGEIIFNAPSSTLSLADGKYLSIQAGKLTATGGTIRATSGSCSLNIREAGGFNEFPIVDITDLTIRNMPATGMYMETETIVVNFRNVSFRDNAGMGAAGSRHLYMWQMSSDDDPDYFHMPGCYFDASADKNIYLAAFGTDPVRVIAEFRDVATNGPRAGEAYDVDDDGDDDGVASLFGGVVEWLPTVVPDLGGSLTGFPLPAFDWNDFTYYATYVASVDVNGAGDDVIYVRDGLGDAKYSYAFPDSAGNIIGQPLWSTEGSSPGVHVLYVALTVGTTCTIYKLIDDGMSLSLPPSPWDTPFTDGFIALTAGPIMDSANVYLPGVYFGISTDYRLFCLERATRTLKIGVIDTAYPLLTTPSWVVDSGKTFAFGATDGSGSGALIHRMEVSPGAAIDAFLSTGRTHDLVSATALINGRLHVAARDGYMYGVDALAPGFGALAGSWPFRDEVNHLVSSLNAENHPLSGPYVDPGTHRIYFGEAYTATENIHLYALEPNGSLVTGFPVTFGFDDAFPTSGVEVPPLFLEGVIVFATTNGEVLFYDESQVGMAGFLFFKSHPTGAAATSVSYNISTGYVLVGSAAGEFFQIPFPGDPTP